MPPFVPPFLWGTQVFSSEILVKQSGFRGCGEYIKCDRPRDVSVAIHQFQRSCKADLK